MTKFMNVDVISCLERIVKKNTVFFQTDFETDKITIAEYAASNNPEDKVLVWMSRFHGTWCFRERDVFMINSGAYNTWLYYDYDDSVFIYTIELIGVENGIVIGNIYTIDYPKYRKKIKEQSFEPHTTTYYFENGKAHNNIVEIDRSFIEKHKGLGKFKYFETNPENEEEFQLWLRQEAALRQSMRAGNFDKYIGRLKQRLND